MQREQVQMLMELRRALQRELGIMVDVEQKDFADKLLRLSLASEKPKTRKLAEQITMRFGCAEPQLYRGAHPQRPPVEAEEQPESEPTKERQIKGYYRGQPVYAD